MNLDKKPSRDDFCKLLATCDDSSSDHLLWVCNGGEVHITPVAAGKPPPWKSIRFRYETCPRKSGKVGPDAAADDAWVRKLWDETIVRDWERNRCGLLKTPQREERAQTPRTPGFPGFGG